MKNIIKQRVLLEIVFVLLGTFLAIFVFKKLGAINSSIIGVLVQYLGIFVSFPLLGLKFAKWKLNTGQTFSFGIVLSALSFLILFLGDSELVIFAFLFVWGCGNGLVWHGINISEIIQINQENKALYVSTVGFYRKFVSVIIPIILSFVFLYLGNFTYYLIFATASAALLVSAYFARQNFNFIPPKTDADDWKSFWFNREVLLIQAYQFIDGMAQSVYFALMPLATYLILTNEVNVGLYQSVASLLTLLMLYIYKNKRSKESNGNILIIATFGLIPFMLYFAYTPNIVSFVCLSIATALCIPQISISKHFIDLSSMKIGSKNEQSFYANMLFREMVLFAGRIFSGLIFLYYLLGQTDNFAILSYGFIYIAVFLGVKAIVGYFLIKRL
jgi:hypothetical protein